MSTFKFEFYFTGLTITITDQEILFQMGPTLAGNENATIGQGVNRRRLAGVMGTELYTGAFDDNGKFISHLLAHPALQMLEFFWGSPESMSKCVRLMGSKSDLKYGPPETTLGRNCLQQLVETSSLSLKRQ